VLDTPSEICGTVAQRYCEVVSDEPKACKNTDRELWRASDSYYAPSIHVTEGSGIGMNVGGRVIVMPIEDWHSLGVAALKARGESKKPPRPTIEELEAILDSEENVPLTINPDGSITAG
jgi:hypothetical protein